VGVHCKSIFVSFLRYSASNNGVTLEYDWCSVVNKLVWSKYVDNSKRRLRLYQSTGAPKRTEQNSFVRIGKSQDEDSIIIKDYSNALEVLYYDARGVVLLNRQTQLRDGRASFSVQVILTFSTRLLVEAFLTTYVKTVGMSCLKQHKISSVGLLDIKRSLAWLRWYCKV